MIDYVGLFSSKCSEYSDVLDDDDIIGFKSFIEKAESGNSEYTTAIKDYLTILANEQGVSVEDVDLSESSISDLHDIAGIE